MTKTGVIATCCSLLSCVGAQAQIAPDYRCTVERVESAGSASQGLENWRKLHIGKDFTVSRRTGVMAGALKNSFVTAPVVIDQGSADNSFKAIATMRKDQGAGAGSNVYVLIIKEFQAGPKKPFTFLDNDVVFLGSCVHY